MSQKYNFHYWGGCFYFCNGYLKYCPQSKVFRNGIQMSLSFVIIQSKLYSFLDKTSIEYANKSYNKNVLNRPAWIFHLESFVNTQNLIEHLVKLIARKLMPVPALKQQADVINRTWSQLERLIKSYHITMLSSKLPPNVSPPYLQYPSFIKILFQLKVNLEGFIIEKFIQLKDNVVQVEWSFIISTDGLELQHGKQTQSMFPCDSSEEIDAKASSLDVNLDKCLEICINSFYGE